jgi:hypothetical protein
MTLKKKEQTNGNRERDETKTQKKEHFEDENASSSFDTIKYDREKNNASISNSYADNERLLHKKRNTNTKTNKATQQDDHRKDKYEDSNVNFYSISNEEYIPLPQTWDEFNRDSDKYRGHPIWDICSPKEYYEWTEGW